MTPQRLEAIKQLNATFAQAGPLAQALDEMIEAYEQLSVSYGHLSEMSNHQSDMVQLQKGQIEALYLSVDRIERRWREASQHKSFRSHYRKTMELCADELAEVLK